MKKEGIILFFLVSLFILKVNALCGDAILDSGELCDPLLATCCNSTCSGYYEITDIIIQYDTPLICGPIFLNYLTTTPQLIDPTLLYQWLILTKPFGSLAYIENKHSQTNANIVLDVNGVYEITLQITTQSCGDYFANNGPFVINVTDCCGNRFIDTKEQCDTSESTNGCCNPDTCQFEPISTPCYDADNLDSCTTSFSCMANGICVSDQNTPFILTAEEVTTIVDSQCSTDIRQFDFHVDLTDPDNVPGGSYTWSVSIVDQFPAQHFVVISSGTLFSPGVIPISIRMEGGGYIQALVEVTDGCGLNRSILYAVYRNCCGNLILNTGEACDDGNLLNGDYCNSICTSVTGSCGDYIVQSNEVCDYASQTCCSPTCQSILPNNTICRQSYGECDEVEVCTGLTPICPSDKFSSSSKLCYDSLGPCDPPVTCSGSYPTCPPNGTLYPSTYMCRSPKGICDSPEYCDAINVWCPTDLYSSALCRYKNGQCDIAEYCSQTSPDCPSDQVLSGNTTCYVTGTGCDIAHCDGMINGCVLATHGGCRGENNRLKVSPANLSTCLTVSCVRNGCHQSITDGTCFIDGTCYAHGDLNPANPCKSCNPDMSKISWTSVANGTRCLTLNPTSSCSAPLDMCFAGTCVDQYLNSSNTCREARSVCDVPESCSGTSDYCPLDQFAASTIVCRNSTDDCDAQETCTGYTPDCPRDLVLPTTLVCRPANGTCDIPDTCDGVNKGCPVDAVHPTSVQCRRSYGICDLAEMCDGVNPGCPFDIYAPSNTTCRAKANLCDSIEYCTGVSAPCPPDSYAGPDVICRFPVDKCDSPERCTGYSLSCPVDVYYGAGTMCRPVNGSCDIAEVCSGSSVACPLDRYQGSDWLCRPPIGTCDQPEFCSGDNNDCPEDLLQPSSFNCRPIRGPCDEPEYCMDDNGICPLDLFKSSNNTCRIPKGPCDQPEMCSGDSAPCPNDLKVPNGTICRFADGVCDVPEWCNGISDYCPSDLLASANFICRLSRGVCDPPETCTGYAVQCPADILFGNTTLCRIPIGTCDEPEYCDAENPDCPLDNYADNMTVCSNINSQCITAQNCSGSSGICPSPTYAPSGTQCETDSLDCTIDGCNSNGQCVVQRSTCQCSVDNDCGVSEFCLRPTCLNHLCRQQLYPGFCFIDGSCMLDGTTNPNNSCEECNSIASQVGWTPRPRGISCTTLTPEGVCSGQDVCDGAGTCIDVQLVGQTCRDGISVCDIPETCQFGIEYCPIDTFANSSVICRPANGTCDVPETCTGHSNACSEDLVASSATVCKNAVGLCDQETTCDGVSKDCPLGSVKPQGVVCRGPVDGCDRPEVCDGESTDCPLDMVEPAGFICRPPIDQCDHPETCDGRIPSCPPDTAYPQGYVCRSAKSSCDKIEVCDGNSFSCPFDSASPSTQVCRPVNGTCDVAENCDGILFDCPPDLFLAQGTICHTATDICDLTQICPGNSSQCPALAYAPSSTICRLALSICDITDYCTSFGPSCPIDIRRPNGFSCSDGNFCNGDEVCLNAQCMPSSSPRNCSSGLGNGLDICDTNLNRCIHFSLPGMGAACYTGPVGSANVGICQSGIGTSALGINGSFVCTGEILPNPTEICHNGLDDNCNGQIDEFCSGMSCVSDSECSILNHGSCQTPLCNITSNTCIFPTNSNYCFINETCYSNYTFSVQTPCKRCIPTTSQTSWTNYDNAIVTDGNVCNGVEMCLNGNVVLNPPALQCVDPTNPCKEYTCDPSLGCQSTSLPDNTPCSIHHITCSSPPVCGAGRCHCLGSLTSIEGDSTSTLVIVITAISVGIVIALMCICIWIFRDDANILDAITDIDLGVVGTKVGGLVYTRTGAVRHTYRAKNE